jgi:cell division protein FtsW (lipid II flippase)
MFSCSVGPSWITYAIDFVLLISGLLAVLVMQKADQDQQINRIDSAWIRKSRRLAFIAVAMFAFLVIITDMSQLSLLLLFASAGVLLLIDIIALENRPPNKGRKHSFVTGVVRRGPLRQILSRKQHSE